MMQRSNFIPVLVLLAGLSVTSLSTDFAGQSIRLQDQQRFCRFAEGIHNEVERRIELYEVGLRGFRMLFESSTHVDHREFTRSVDVPYFDSRFPGALGVGYIEAVDDKIEALREFQQRLRDEGCPEFEIVAPKSEHAVTSQLLNKRLIIRQIEPYVRNRQALGLEIGAEPTRRQAAEETIRLGEACISGRIQLVQSNRQQAGFLYMIPHFERGAPINTVEQRLAAIQGWVYMPIVAEQALGNLGETSDMQLEYRLCEASSEDASMTLCESEHYVAAVDVAPFRKAFEFEIGNRKWVLHVIPSESFSYTDTTLFWMVWGCGFLLSVLVAGLVWTIKSEAIAARNQAAEMSLDVRRLAMVAERTTNSVVITDCDQHILWCNDAFTQLSGYTSEECLGKKPGHLLQCKETDPKTIQAIRQVLRQYKGFRGEIYNQSKTGRKYWVFLDIQPLTDDSGQVIGFVSVENDITEQKRVAAELQAASERTELALDGGHLGLWEWDLSTDAWSTDKRWGEIMGSTEDPAAEFAGFWIARTHPDDMEILQKAIAKCIESRKVAEVEVRQWHVDGHYVWVNYRGIVASAPDDPVMRLTGTVMETTQRKEAEVALRESEAFATAMFMSSNEAIMVWDGMKLIECNQTTVDLFGFEEKEQILGLSPLELSPKYQLDGRTSSELHHEIATQAQTSRHERFEWLHQRADGSTFQVEVVLSFIELGEKSLVLSSLRDISQSKEIERKLAQSQKLQSIGQLAAGIAHEINTPMQCVFSNVEYLEQAIERVLNMTEDAQSICREASENHDESMQRLKEIAESPYLQKARPNIREALKESTEASHRVIDIVRAMKAMSHPGSIEKTMSNINTLVMDATTISRNRWKSIAEIQLELSEDLPTIPLMQGQFSQVILNLIVNAADAISEKLGTEPLEPGRIRIRTSNVDHGILLEVEDTGSGMPQSVQNRIFDPFFTTKDVGKGTGQGLAIAYDTIVNQHLGRMSVFSIPGVGTTMSVWLPFANAPQKELSNQESEYPDLEFMV